MHLTDFYTIRRAYLHVNAFYCAADAIPYKKCHSFDKYKKET